ncbi:hypothetical protein [Neobacillus ginsengisoli]|uniref:Uncharacterized protein n=1 Tax=Neobacillus ginsengisoli TaxID=904295 RepID=A0ABT9XTT4_9BACI|nr:hypothetical protein [Neobacillus ginsengisoli]MDQ0198967.1 hypothetical protein [Neobacillus ginsengisoli]
MSDFFESIIELIGDLVTEKFKKSKIGKKRQKLRQENVEKNIKLLSEQEWFANLLDNPQYNKLIYNQMDDLLHNQGFVNNLVKGDMKTKQYFMKTLDNKNL